MRVVAMKSEVLRILVAVAAAILLMPLDASAHTSSKVHRIGTLDMTSPDLRSPTQMAFYEELRKLGYVEGQNLVVERRSASGEPDRLPFREHIDGAENAEVHWLSGPTVTGRFKKKKPIP